MPDSIRRIVKPSRRGFIVAFTVLGVLAIWIASASSSDRLALRVELGSRAVSKLPFLIAADQGLYEKYGLDIDLRMPPADFEGGLGERPLLLRGLDRLLGRRWQAEVFLNGATPEVVGMVNNLDHPRFTLLASTDCIVRSHIIARHGIEGLEELKGKRIGVTGLMHNITGYVALELADRMGWDPVHDISIILNGADIESLREGRVDAIVGRERDYAEAQEEGFPILLDTRTWGDLPMGGNSVRVGVSWLEDPLHQEAMRRFLMALVEAVALFHEDRELALDVVQRWNGVPRWYAEIMYDRSAIPHVPFPCYEGIRRTMEVYDSHEMRAYSPEDFYDDAIIRELEEGGFVDSVYAAIRALK